MLIRADLQTAVSVEPITLAEAKLHLRVDHSGEDTFISAAIISARQKAEAICSRRFGSQTWELTFNTFDDVRLIQCGKVASVVASVRNADGTWSEVPSGQYELVKSVPAVVRFLNAFERPAHVEYQEALKVQVTCGEAPANAVKSWMLLFIGTLFENRESDSAQKTEHSEFVDSLLAPYRVMEYR